MGASTEPAIVCSGCGKRYKWKPELAGRKVKCKCGAVVAVPAAPAPASEPEDDLYALAEDNSGPPVASVAPMVPIAPIPPIAPPAPGRIAPIPTPQQAMAGAAAARAGGAMLGYRPRATAREAERGSAWGIEGSPIKDFWLPVGCIAVGLIISLIDWMVLNEVDFVWAMLAVGIGTVVEMVILTIGCLIVMKLMDIALGAPLQALLKIVGVAIAPGAIGSILASSFEGGWMVGWGVSFLMYIFLLMAFFDLDGSEVMILSAIIWMLKQAGSYLVMFLLAGALLDGGGSGGGGSIGGMGGMGIVGGNEEMSAKEIDASLGDILKDEPGVEARQWLAGKPARTFYTLSREQSQSLVNRLYAAGAVNAQATGIEDGLDTATMLIVTVPSDSAARKRIFAIENDFDRSRGYDEFTTDVGQKYIEFYFDD